MEDTATDPEGKLYTKKQKIEHFEASSPKAEAEKDPENFFFQRASSAKLNLEVKQLINRFVDHYVDPKNKNTRMSSLQLNPHFYPYYHENPLTSSERERVITTLAQSFSGLEFKGNQMFLEQVFRLRPNVLQFIKWVNFNSLPSYGGARLRGNEVVMDQWIFSTEALEPGSRQLPGQLLTSRRQQNTQAVYNYGVGFVTSMDYFMDPTKLNAYNKNLEATSVTILQTMEKQLLTTLVQKSTMQNPKYQTPFGNQNEMTKAFLAMSNLRFGIQKNGAGMRALETNAYNQLRNTGHTPEAVLVSPEVFRHESVVNPDNRVLTRVGRSAAEADPARNGGGYDLQTVNAMATPTYGLRVHQSRSFRNMDTEDSQDPTHTDMFNSSRWFMHPLPQEHEKSRDYRTAHRTIGIVDGDREQVRYISLRDVLDESGLWEKKGSGKEWTNEMKVFLNAIYEKQDPTLKEVCEGKSAHVPQCIRQRVLTYTKDKDAYPEYKKLYSIFATTTGTSSSTRLTAADVADYLKKKYSEYFPALASTKHGGYEAEKNGFESYEELKACVEQWIVGDMYNADRFIVKEGETKRPPMPPAPSSGSLNGVHTSDSITESNWNYFLYHLEQRHKQPLERLDLTLQKIEQQKFTADVADAMLDADVPFPMTFKLERMHERFVGGSAVYFGRQSLVMAVKSCSLLCNNDADTFQTEVQVKFQAGAVVLDSRSLLAQHNIVAVSYESGAGTEFHKWGTTYGEPDGPSASLIATPLPNDACTSMLYSCVHGYVPENILPHNYQTEFKDKEQRLYKNEQFKTRIEQELCFHANPVSHIFTAEGTLRPSHQDQVLSLRGACYRYDIHAGRMVDTQEGRTALGKSCSVEQFQQLKGVGSDVAGDGIRGATYGGMPALG